MKSTIVITISLLGIVNVLAMPQQQPNIDTILKNNRVLDNYIRCVLDKGACNKAGKELKALLPDALRTGCSRCTADQKRNAMKIIRFLRQRKPAEWQAITNKYDPSGLFNEARFNF